MSVEMTASEFLSTQPLKDPATVWSPEWSSLPAEGYVGGVCICLSVPVSARMLCRLKTHFSHSARGVLAWARCGGGSRGGPCQVLRRVLLCCSVMGTGAPEESDKGPDWTCADWLALSKQHCLWSSGFYATNRIVLSDCLIFGAGWRVRELSAGASLCEESCCTVIIACSE